MLDEKSKFFCHRIRTEKGRLVREGNSYRYTLITLLGLNKLHLAKGMDPFNIESLLPRLIESMEHIKCAGDAGLLLWLCALTEPDRIPRVLARLDAGNLLTRFDDSRRRKTVELSWLLTGLSYAKYSGNMPHAFLEQLANDTWQQIRRNYGGRGIFRHEGHTSFAGILRADLALLLIRCIQSMRFQYTLRLLGTKMRRR